MTLFLKVQTLKIRIRTFFIIARKLFNEIVCGFLHLVDKLSGFDHILMNFLKFIVVTPIFRIPRTYPSTKNVCFQALNGGNRPPGSETPMVGRHQQCANTIVLPASPLPIKVVKMTLKGVKWGSRVILTYCGRVIAHKRSFLL